MIKLNSDDAQPLYKQLYESIRYNITNGEYQPGQRLPSEEDLCKLYGVSRITVRNALDELSNTGFITRKRGKGTFVTKNHITHHLTEKISFSETCILNGFKPGAKVIRAVIEKASPIDVTMLKIDKDERVVIIERLRYADEIPVSIEENRFSQDYTFLLNEELNNSSLYTILKEKYGVQIIDNRATVEIVFATYEQALYLNIEEGYPLLCITTCPVDANNKPIHSSRHFTVGDKFKFTI
ncbi:GntR family transcriptional regulator [Fusibacter bizertensis]